MDAAHQRTPEADDSKLKVERLVGSSVTCLKLSGTIDEAFEGKRLAATIEHKNLILDLGNVKRISSFGIREWSEFIERVERSVDHLIVIECPPRVVDQLNMVSGFLGNKARVLSFYAPYRCDYCDLDSRHLLRVDRDSSAIRSGEPPECKCQSCARPAYLDEDVKTFFAFAESQPHFDVAPEILDFMATKLGDSASSDQRRLQINKYVSGQYTCLELVGGLDGRFASSKVAEGLEGEVVIDVTGVTAVDLAGAAEWRNLIAETRHAAEKIHLLGCPTVLLDHLSGAADLGDNVVSLAMPYSCSKCRTTSTQIIDVEANYDLLSFATPSQEKCPHCKSAMICVMPEELLARLRELPRPDNSSALRNFIKEAKARKAEKKAPPKEKKASGRGPALWAAVAIAALVVAGGMVGLNYLQQRDRVTPVAAETGAAGGVAEVTKPTDNRPDWISSDQPGQAGCFDTPTRVYCVGVSRYMPGKKEAQEEAYRVSVEELVNLLVLRAETGPIASQRARYWPARQEKLAAVDKLRRSDNTEVLHKSLDGISENWTNVAASFEATAGAGIVVQSDAFWEEYDSLNGAGTEFLGFVQIELSNAAVESLMRLYNKPLEVADAELVPVFPGLAWHAKSELSGLYVVSPGKLSSAGVAEGEIITEVGGEALGDLTQTDRVAELLKGAKSAGITKADLD